MTTRAPIRSPLGPPIQSPLKPPPWRKPGGTPPAVDPFWSSVVLLLQGDTLTDASGRHALITNDGAVVPGPTGLFFNGGSALRIDDNLADFAPTGSFTIDGEATIATITASTFILLSTYIGVPGDWQFFTRGAPNFQGGVFATSGAYIEPPAPPWATGAPVAFAFQYDADALPTPVASLYVGGDRIGMSVAAGNYAPSPPNPLYIGRESATVAKFLNGFLRLRMTHASRGYGASYIPPTWPVPTS